MTTKLSVIPVGFDSGVWHGLVETEKPQSAAPNLFVSHKGDAIDGVEITPGEAPGTWVLRVPVPREVLNDGVQTFLVCDAEEETVLSHFAINCGLIVEQDVLAEMDLIRAELEILKRAVRALSRR